jgi:choline dehydrogenase-like flavoprotein
MLTQATESRRALCHYCGHCGGCEVDAKYTSANTPIPAALATGNLKLFTDATMTRILMDKSRNRVSGIEYSSSAGGVEKIECKSLVLACSAIETARQLLINGLANGSGQVGKNLTSHFGLTVVGVFPELKNRDASNDDGTGYYHSLLTGLYWDKPNPNFEGTYQVQCGAGMHPQRMMIRSFPGYGLALKRGLKEANICNAGMNMQGSLLISPRKFVDLDRSRLDRFGQPLPRVHLTYEQSDIAMGQDMVETCEEIIRAGGGEVFSTPGKVTADKLVIDYNHWVGTVRMGRDPKASVVNTDCQSHEIPNLFVGDASVFAAYPEKNPTLTNIALSWRMSDNLVEKSRRGEL